MKVTQASIIGWFYKAVQDSLHIHYRRSEMSILVAPVVRVQDVSATFLRLTRSLVTIPQLHLPETLTYTPANS